MTIHSLSQDLAPQMPQGVRGVLTPLQRHINRFFDDVAQGANMFVGFNLSPTLDLIELPDAIEVAVELPGLTRDDVRIDFSSDHLTITGEKKTEHEQAEGAYRVLERSTGRFSRTVYLPASVDSAGITAVMKDGVLRITAPKVVGADQRTIEIQAA